MPLALSMSAVVLAFAALMLGVLALRRHGKLGGEACRKSIHIGMGLVTLSFPWLFHEIWPVLVLTFAFVALLLALRLVPALRTRFGAALCGIERDSWGDLYFPLAIGALFALTHGEPLYYVIPVLILTLADAAAALAGDRLGRHRYQADEGEKSWEGSFAFFLVAFACTYAVQLHAGNPGQGALIALCVALVTMLLEGTAWRGLDNLFIPFATLLMLRLYRDLPSIELWQRLGVLTILAALHFSCRRHALLREGTLFGASLMIFLCWAFGGLAWMAAPIVVVAVHPLLARGVPPGVPYSRQSHLALLAVGAPPLVWLFLNRLLALPGFAPFHAALGAALAMMAVSLWRTADRPLGLLLPPCAAVIGWALIVLPWWLLGWISSPAAHWSAAAIAAAVLAFHLLQKKLDRKPVRHWLARALLASLASLAAM